MKRKVSHIILTILLLLATIGLTISKHYCGEELISVEIFSEAESCCEMDGCCHNESETMRVEDDFTAKAFNFSLKQGSIELPTLFHLSDIIIQEKKIDIRDHSPLLLPAQTILASLQTFLL